MRLLNVNVIMPKQPLALPEGDIKRIRGVLYLNGLRGSDVDDGVQDVQIRMLERGSGVHSPSAWACVVATRVALDLRRRELRWQRLQPRLWRAPREEMSQHGEMGDFALRATVKEGLRTLDPELRVLVILRFYGDLTLPEIAEALDLPLGTVKSRLHRGLRQLRTLLRSEAPDER